MSNILWMPSLIAFSLSLLAPKISLILSDSSFFWSPVASASAFTNSISSCSLAIDRSDTSTPISACSLSAVFSLMVSSCAFIVLLTYSIALPTSTMSAGMTLSPTIFDPCTPSLTFEAISMYSSIFSTIAGSILANSAANAVRLPNLSLFFDSCFICDCNLFAWLSFSAYAASLNTLSA